MENKPSSFYHLQIAKCGGTYLNNVIIHQLFNILKNNNISYIDGEYHLGWQEIENNYVISSLRDPVKRTVSHYAYYKNGGQNGPIPENVPNFMDWVEINKDFISNYQIKNFLYTKKNFDLNPFNPTAGLDPDFLTIKIDKVTAFDRIKSVNVLLKDTQLNNQVCNTVMKKILKDFNITDSFYIDNKKKYDHNITKGSAELYNSLTKQNIDYLYNLNNLDSEIYFSQSVYFNAEDF
jgi:hypothetical protein